MPSTRWFPYSLQDRAAWFDNFDQVFGNVYASLGLTATDKGDVSNDNGVMQWLAAADVAYQSSISAFREYRDIILEGKIGDTTPANPQPIIPGGPPATVPAGLFERLDKMVARIKASPTYANNIGVQLGIVAPDAPPSLAPDELKPNIKAKVMPGSQAEVAFVRGQTNGIRLDYQRNNDAGWTLLGTFLASPAMFAVPPLNPNMPETVRLRARFVQGNNAIGQYSDIVTIITEP